MKLFNQFGNDVPKRKAIWRGIVHKAQQDGDHSLDGLADNDRNNRTRTAWLSAAAALLITLGCVYFFVPSSSDDKYVQAQDLESIFADTLSYSKLVLSTGDTVALDDPHEVRSDIAYLQDEAKVFDFRKLDNEVFGEKIQLIETGRGKQLHFILADGTKVWLNASSKIEFPGSFDTDIRQVQISGEVYFEVAHDQHKPFIVQTDDQQIKVLGTHFNVKQYRDDTEKRVTLLEGAIEVVGQETESRPFRLLPSQQFVQINSESPKIRRLANPETSIAWKEGTFYFEDADAQDIIKELERWYPVKIKLKHYTQDKKISGRIRRSDSLSKVIDMLQFFDIQILVEKD